MSNLPPLSGHVRSVTAFDGHRRLASGPLAAVAPVVARAMHTGALGPLLVFDDATGAVVDIDWRGTDDEVAARYETRGAVAPEAPARGPGRPRLGVVAREVTLLPAQWEWLARQPGGASVTLRKLIERARREDAGLDAGRVAREATYRFLHAIGGDLPHFEAIARALFAREDEALRALLDDWPADVRTHALAILRATPSPDR